MAAQCIFTSEVLDERLINDVYFRLLDCETKDDVKSTFREVVLPLVRGWDESKHPRGGNPKNKGEFSSRSSGSQIKGLAWPTNFPEVEGMTNGDTLTNHPDYEAAKAGDSDAAASVIESIIKVDKVKTLGEKYPNAKIVPVHAEEAKGRNKLPVQFASYIQGITGQSVDLGIVQSNRVHHTGAKAAWRFAHRAEFSGDVQKGQEYILVDDFVTAGGTVNELRRYIESNGGKVVAVTSLANAHSAQTGNSRYLAIKKETLLSLNDKFGYTNLHEFLSEYGIYNGNPESLTNSEAKWLLSFGSLDRVRDRIAKG